MNNGGGNPRRHWGVICGKQSPLTPSRPIFSLFIANQKLASKSEISRIYLRFSLVIVMLLRLHFGFEFASTAYVLIGGFCSTTHQLPPQ